MLLRAWEAVRVGLFYLDSFIRKVLRTRRFASPGPRGRETALLAILRPRRYQGRGFRGRMIQLENRYPLFGIMRVSPA
jgi:hypothetical protein